MTRLLFSLTIVSAVLTAFTTTQIVAGESPLDYKMKSLTGEEVDLSQYKGKVVMVVNVASKCGATPQYAPLQDLYKKHKADGLVVLGFPCNQFGKQEPGDAGQIQEFCEKNYGVEFPMMEKIDVNGPGAAPIYKDLTSAKTLPKTTGPIGWNFEKFVIGKDGQVAARFGTSTEPDSDEVIAVIKKELAK